MIDGKCKSELIPYGLAVRIPGFHPGGPGSTPGVGMLFILVFLLLSHLAAQHSSKIINCTFAYSLALHVCSFLLFKLLLLSYFHSVTLPASCNAKHRKQQLSNSHNRSSCQDLSLQKLLRILLYCTTT